MRLRINKLSLGILLLAFLPHPGLAEGEDGFEAADDRWVPSFSFSGGVLVQQMDSSVESHCALGRPEEEVVFRFDGQATSQTRPACRDPSHILAPAFDPDTMETVGDLRPAVEDSELGVTPFVGASLQLMTPRLGLLPGEPRAFVAGEVLTFWPTQRDIAREGAPEGVQFPPPQSDTEAQYALRFQADALFGVGSRTRSEVQRLGYAAQAGLAFPFHYRGRRLWLKPSAGWLRFGVDVEGTVIAALKDDGFGISPLGAQIDLRPGPGIRAINLSANAEKTWNAIGGGLELELEAGRFGRLGVSVFLSGNAYRVLGDRTVTLSDSVTCDPPDNPCLSGLVNQAPSRVQLRPFFPPSDDPLYYEVPAGTMVPDVGVSIDQEPFSPFGADTYDATWEYSVDSWAYRAGVGIRIHWLGN